MASRLFGRSSSQLLGCLPCSLAATASPHTSRPFSVYRQHPGRPIIDVKTLSHDSSFSWPDTRLGPLEPKDKRFPLPGLVGSSARPPRELRSALGVPRYDADVLTAELAHERQSSAVEQFVTVQRQQDEERATPLSTQGGDVLPSTFDQFECMAHDCPHFLFTDFCDIFPNYRLAVRSLTVITLSQRPQEVWTTGGEGARGGGAGKEGAGGEGAVGGGVEGLADKVQLMEAFIVAATDICEVLHDAGFWADFIDPTSGRPYVGNQPVIAAGFEVDERYRRLGFEIETSGGCRVLQHHPWGSRPYVGCLFTNTPLTHPLISNIVRPSGATEETVSEAKETAD